MENENLTDEQKAKAAYEQANKEASEKAAKEQAEKEAAEKMKLQVAAEADRLSILSEKEKELEIGS